jgi:hypothetical protein
MGTPGPSAAGGGVPGQESVESTPASALQRLKQRVSRTARLGGQVHKQQGPAAAGGMGGMGGAGVASHHVRSVSQPGVSTQAQIKVLAAGGGMAGTTAPPPVPAPGTVAPGNTHPWGTAGDMMRAASDPVQGLPTQLPAPSEYAGPVLPPTRPNMPRFTQLDAHGRAGVLAVLGGAGGPPVQVTATDQGLTKGLAVGQPTGVRPSAGGVAQGVQTKADGAGQQGSGVQGSSAGGETAAAAAAIMARADELRRQLDAALQGGSSAPGAASYEAGARGSPGRGLLGRLGSTAVPFLTEPSVMADLLAGSPGSAPASLAGSPTRYRAGGSPAPHLQRVGTSPGIATVSLDAGLHILPNLGRWMPAGASPPGVLPNWGEYHQAAYTDEYTTQGVAGVEEDADDDGAAGDQGLGGQLLRRGKRQLRGAAGTVRGSAATSAHGRAGKEDGDQGASVRVASTIG